MSRRHTGGSIRRIPPCGFIPVPSRQISGPPTGLLSAVSDAARDDVTAGGKHVQILFPQGEFGCRW